MLPRCILTLGIPGTRREVKEFSVLPGTLSRDLKVGEKKKFAVHEKAKN
jgi:hypothetical protein